MSSGVNVSRRIYSSHVPSQLTRRRPRYLQPVSKLDSRLETTSQSARGCRGACCGRHLDRHIVKPDLRNHFAVQSYSLWARSGSQIVSTLRRRTTTRADRSYSSTQGVNPGCHPQPASCIRGSRRYRKIEQSGSQWTAVDKCRSAIVAIRSFKG